jgi:hypothetical protein
MAILMTSQHRGNYRDAHFAGGPAIAHTGNAVIKIDADFVNPLDRKYYAQPRGTMARTIRILKTANNPHSYMEHYYSIDANGSVRVGEPIPATSLLCITCGEMIDYEHDEYVTYPKAGVRHLKHVLEKEGKSSVALDKNSGKKSHPTLGVG